MSSNNSSTVSTPAASSSAPQVPTTNTTTKPTTSKPSRKPRCNFKDCKTLAQPIVGDCGFCQKHYCGKHRMLESHNCSGLEDCKKVERERIRDKLEGERTIAIKGL